MGQEIDRAARVRAARAIAGLKQPELGEKLSTSAQTVKRMESGDKQVSIEELRLIADVCGVPHWFMEGGFGGWEEAQILHEATQTAERMERMLAAQENERRRDMARLTARLAEIELEMDRVRDFEGAAARQRVELAAELAALAAEKATAERAKQAADQALEERPKPHPETRRAS